MGGGCERSVFVFFFSFQISFPCLNSSECVKVPPPPAFRASKFNLSSNSSPAFKKKEKKSKKKKSLLTRRLKLLGVIRSMPPQP